ncbi:MAG: hypothetical protein AAGE94_16565 [Acidobacteriota bacterium]
MGTAASHGARLGERLVSTGRLKLAELTKALDTQKLVGGRLGTVLLELGLVGEETLLQALGEQRATRTAPIDALRRISPAVRRAVPEKLVRRYHLVPYAVRGKTLLIASMDPGDLLREDEIQFLTSFMVRTHLAVEFQVRVALHRHYGEPLQPRFRALAKRLAGASSGLPASTTPSAPVPSTAASAGENPAVSRAAGEMTAGVASKASAPAPTATPIDDEPTEVELDAVDLERLWRPSTSAIDLAALEARIDADEPAAASLSTEASIDEPEPDEASVDEADDEDLEQRLDRAARALMAAEIRDEIGDVLLDVAGRWFRRRVLLVGRKDPERGALVVGWRGAGDGVDEATVRDLVLDATAPSVVSGLRESGSFWLGPLPPLPGNRRLVAALGGDSPRDCLVLSVALRGRVVCHLYVDDLDASVAGKPVAAMKRLAAKAGLAFEVYILKNKLRVL